MFQQKNSESINRATIQQKLFISQVLAIFAIICAFVVAIVAVWINLDNKISNNRMYTNLSINQLKTDIALTTTSAVMKNGVEIAKVLSVLDKQNQESTVLKEEVITNRGGIKDLDNKLNDLDNTTTQLYDLIGKKIKKK